MTIAEGAFSSRELVSLRRVHWLLGVQSLVVILLSVNRLSSLTEGYVLPNEFLRWVDFNNMLVLPLISVVAFYLLKRHMEAGQPAREGRRHLALSLAFVVGVYLLAASYGDHEVTNYLHSRFCLGDSRTDPTLCSIIAYNDDVFSHWVFFLGFILINSALMFFQVLLPYGGKLSATDFGFLGANGLILGLAILANLAFEQIGLDLYVVAGLTILALWLLLRRGAQPLLIYYAVGYSLGLLGTFVVKAAA